MSNELGPMFKASLLKLINDNEDFTEDDPARAVEVLDFEEYEYSTGFCDTCYYEETRVKVVYENALGGTHTYYHCDDFADLVRELTGM